MITYLLDQLGAVTWGEWAGMWGKPDFWFGHTELRCPWDLSVDMFCEQLDIWVWGSKGDIGEIELEGEIDQRNNSKINESN